MTAPNIGLWDKFKEWQPAHRNINPADVTNTVNLFETPDVEAFKRLGAWQA